MRNITDIIPRGHENALTRSELVSMTGLSDRAIRELIAQSKEVVLNLCDGQGYFIPLDNEVDLVKTWAVMFSSRINEELDRLKRASEWVEAHK